MQVVEMPGDAASSMARRITAPAVLHAHPRAASHADSIQRMRTAICSVARLIRLHSTRRCLRDRLGKCHYTPLFTAGPDGCADVLGLVEMREANCEIPWIGTWEREVGERDLLRIHGREMMGNGRELVAVWEKKASRPLVAVGLGRNNVPAPLNEQRTRHTPRLRSFLLYATTFQSVGPKTGNILTRTRERIPTWAPLPDYDPAFLRPSKHRNDDHFLDLSLLLRKSHELTASSPPRGARRRRAPPAATAAACRRRGSPASEPAPQDPLDPKHLFPVLFPLDYYTDKAPDGAGGGDAVAHAGRPNHDANLAHRLAQAEVTPGALLACASHGGRAHGGERRVGANPNPKQLAKKAYTSTGPCATPLRTQNMTKTTAEGTSTVAHLASRARREEEGGGEQEVVWEMEKVKGGRRWKLAGGREVNGVRRRKKRERTEAKEEYLSTRTDPIRSPAPAEHLATMLSCPATRGRATDVEPPYYRVVERPQTPRETLPRAFLAVNPPPPARASPYGRSQLVDPGDACAACQPSVRPERKYLPGQAPNDSWNRGAR
nr:unnamed protein product [Digitaria exilis]